MTRRAAATTLAQLVGAALLIGGMTAALGWAGALAAVGALLLTVGLLAERPTPPPPRPHPRVIPHVPTTEGPARDRERHQHAADPDRD